MSRPRTSLAGIRTTAVLVLFFVPFFCCCIPIVIPMSQNQPQIRGVVQKLFDLNASVQTQQPGTGAESSVLGIGNDCLGEAMSAFLATLQRGGTSGSQEGGLVQADGSLPERAGLVDGMLPDNAALERLLAGIPGKVSPDSQCH